MRPLVLVLCLCVAVVPLPPKRGDGAPVKYVPVTQENPHGKPRR